MATTAVPNLLLSGDDLSHPPHDENLSPTSTTALDRIRCLLSQIAAAQPTSDAPHSLRVTEEQCDRLRELHVILIDTHHRLGRVKDDFRRADGFDALLSVSVCLDKLWSCVGPDRLVFELLKLLLNVLSEAICDYTPNARFFASHDGRNRWKELQTHLVRFYNVLPVRDQKGVIWKRKLFELLISFAVREEGDNGFLGSGDTDSVQLEQAAANRLGVILWMPDAVTIIIALWQALIVPLRKGQRSEYDTRLSLAVLTVLLRIFDSSHYNAVALHEYGSSELILQDSNDHLLIQEEKERLQLLRFELLSLGLSSTDAASHILKHSLQSNTSAIFLERVLTTAKEPLHILFDLSLHGYASLELATLHAPFPPSEQSGGYTFMAWVRIDEYDERCHTTLFGAFDQTQTCFLLLYLERDTKHLVLQTSLSSERPSVRFKSTTFASGRWYHICVVHVYPRADGLGRATLFVDGVFIEKTRCRYPLDPRTSAVNGSSSLEVSTPPVTGGSIQAFLGTPRSLAPRLGTRVLHSRWSLAGCQLVSRAISDELVFVYKTLGPGYVGNFQDSLGSFQTYETSTVLNLRHESLYNGSDDQSTIAKAIKTQARLVNHEQHFALNVVEAGSINDAFYVNMHAPGRPSIEQRNSNQAASSSSTFCFNLAAVRPTASAADSSSLAFPYGGTKFCRLRGLDRYVWQICGGVPYALKLLELASSEEEILRAVHIIFALVRDSWRLSEVFERENGFPIMALLLRSKSFFRKSAIWEHKTADDNVSPLSLRVLQSILANVGYNAEKPVRSIIQNPLAYRSLVVDLDIWRSSESPTQKLFYKQFEDFVTHSRHRQFNIKRLARMRIMKRLINALKSEQLHKDTLPLMLPSLKSLLVNIPSADVYRSVALYITYAVSDQNKRTIPYAQPALDHHTSTSTTGRADSDTQSTGIQGTSINHRAPNYSATPLEIGTGLLDVLAQLLLEDTTGSHVRKFARTVTNKWLLYLLSSRHEAVIGPSMRILSRLLLLQGPSYLLKFEETTRGMMILGRRLKKWWFLDTVWIACFAIMVGIDPLSLPNHGSADISDILKAILTVSKGGIYCETIFSVMASMLEAALSTVDYISCATTGGNVDRGSDMTDASKRDHGFANKANLIVQVLRAYREAHDSIPQFKDFCVRSTFIRDLLRAFFERASGSQSPFSPTGALVIPDLRSLDTAPDPKHLDSATSSEIMGEVSTSAGPLNMVFPQRRRHSSFVVIPSTGSRESLTSLLEARDNESPLQLELDGFIQDDVLLLHTIELIVDVLMRNIMDRKHFTGLGLFHKAPPCSFNVRAKLNAYLICKTMQKLQKLLATDPDQFNEPKVVMNIAKFSTQALEAYIEGWLVHGAACLVEFNITLLNHWQKPHVQAIKDVRLCSPSLGAMRSTLARTSLLHIAKATDAFSGLNHLSSLSALPMWIETMLAEPGTTHEAFRPLFCAILRLIPEAEGGELEQAQSILRILTTRELDEIIRIFDDPSFAKHVTTFNDLYAALQESPGVFSKWLTDHDQQALSLSLHAKNTVLMPFVAQEEQAAAISIEMRCERRRERVEQWHLEDVASSHVWTEHEVATNNWIENIVRSEAHKYWRSLQDQQEGYEFLKFRYEKMSDVLPRVGLIDLTHSPLKWQLDECEGRDRMRLRLSPSAYAEEIEYEPKTLRTQRRKTRCLTGPQEKSGMQSSQSADRDRPSSHAAGKPAHQGPSHPQHTIASRSGNDIAFDEFEVIAEQHIDEEDEDKNRKVMRSLQRGEQVQNAFNISRIIGLEAHEGLLIIGKTSLYLVDGLFQRSDGEVVSVEQAPGEERDKYTRILSGHEMDHPTPVKKQFEPTRNWPWTDILSFSKRQFLTRPVAVEVFFADGRSYLLTTTEELQRDALYTDLLKSTKTLRENARPETENAWRRDLLKDPNEGSSKLSQFLSPMVASQMTKKWIKGDVSNFHYLMWVNSQAGRTFNDLTQYPVFPWVLADYTSPDLDLSNPRSYRDLSKPMGCQTIERAESFQERYASLAEMDEQTPPFHYGTHYSSAMIVTSFLIRLQPFVQSHVLLQGGSFDHANRLFHSIEQAWRSASGEGLSDVRELIPEFYYLPDFLRNVNCYNFGFRQGDNEIVDNVKLPPWAKGDPEIFISKHREALESPFVSQNLHAWIDLVFGFKQRGEAARESTNVFHYLSYPGAKDLDTIHDQHERAATIGIIHNFGQTPRQIFSRPHDRRENILEGSAKLHNSMRSLARLRSPIQKLNTGVSTLHFSRELVAAAFGTCLQPPNFDILADWAYADRSLRLWSADRRKMLGLHEQLHAGAITCGVFADSSTLLTACEYGTISAWRLATHNQIVELHPRSTLFGHRSSVRAVTISRAFSVLLTASADGHVILWDLSRLEFIREVRVAGTVHDAQISDSSGRLLLCSVNIVEVYSLNGHRLLSQDISDGGSEPVTSCNFHQNSSNAWFSSETIITGHAKGVVKIWNLAFNEQGKWYLEALNRLPTDYNVASRATSSITAVFARDQKVWAGDSEGCVFEWNAIR